MTGVLFNVVRVRPALPTWARAQGLKKALRRHQHHLRKLDEPANAVRPMAGRAAPWWIDGSAVSGPI